MAFGQTSLHTHTIPGALPQATVIMAFGQSSRPDSSRFAQCQHAKHVRFREAVAHIGDAYGLARFFHGRIVFAGTVISGVRAEVFGDTFGRGFHGVFALAPVGRANLAVLFCELQGIEQPHCFVDAASQGQVVDQ